MDYLIDPGFQGGKDFLFYHLKIMWSEQVAQNNFSKSKNKRLQSHDWRKKLSEIAKKHNKIGVSLNASLLGNLLAYKGVDAGDRLNEAGKGATTTSQGATAISWRWGEQRIF